MEMRAKYGNRRVVVNGVTFDSRAEARRAGELQMLERVGEISELQLQPRFVLVPSVVLDGRKRPPLRFTADFAYRDFDGRLVVEDVKSPASKTTAYRIRRHLVKAMLGIEVVEVTG